MANHDKEPEAGPQDLADKSKHTEIDPLLLDATIHIEIFVDEAHASRALTLADPLYGNLELFTVEIGKPGLPVLGFTGTPRAQYFPAGTNQLDLSVLTMQQEMLRNEEWTQGARFSDYSLLKWTVAADHGVHPRELTEEFLKRSIAEGELNFRQNCEARGETIASYEELENLSLRAKQMRDEIKERLGLAHAL